MWLVYDSRVRYRLGAVLILGAGLIRVSGPAQDSTPPKPDDTKTEPKYDNTFSGPIMEFSATKITVSRSILGKPAEKRTFLVKTDTRIEGKLRVKAKVTVGFVTTDEGDIARLIVVRSIQKPPQGKK